MKPYKYACVKTIVLKLDVWSKTREFLLIAAATIFYAALPYRNNLKDMPGTIMGWTCTETCFFQTFINVLCGFSVIRSEKGRRYQKNEHTWLGSWLVQRVDSRDGHEKNCRRVTLVCQFLPQLGDNSRPVNYPGEPYLRASVKLLDTYKLYRARYNGIYEMKHKLHACLLIPIQLNIQCSNNEAHYLHYLSS